MDSYVYDMMLDSSVSSQDSSFMSFCLNSTFKQTQLKTKKKHKFTKIFIKKIFKRRDKIVVQEEKTRLSRRITKLMDKSLGWLSKRSKKNSAQNQLNENFVSHEEIMDLNEKFYFHNSSYLLSAPSMCSSFDATKPKSRRLEDQCHSTPRSLLQQFSPIKTIPASPSLCRTSSPVSLNRNIFEQSSQMIDLRLLEHLNEVKRNIRMEADTRKSTDVSADLSMIMEKRKKLKKIFQNRLRKQMREAKRWNLDAKHEFATRKQSTNKRTNQSCFSRPVNERFYVDCDCCRHCHNVMHNQNYFYNFYNMGCHVRYPNFMCHAPNSYFNPIPSYF